MLREKVCVTEGRNPQPLVAMLDSQPVRTCQGGEAIGFEPGKRMQDRKRHLLVDTCDLALRAVVNSASVHDRAGAKLVLSELRAMFPRVGLAWMDRGYVNTVDSGLVCWAAKDRDRCDAAQRWRERLSGAAPRTGSGTDVLLVGML
ncbi:transposase [Planomonospora parontospora]|uniref:transposase n=1 Tax=Planomonospora parontospora TaxID=58119 RepID=UPI001944FB96|nr:transposase [Planomonospora parontospora]GGL27097.1 hypothetical protein GCM10014719_30790 [Planomonospora parontospora subsp. antibiotica]GII16564.1 hypothetical protein Ppa05_32900 [Planomonospora parontospora subsp. antibiotica]